MIHFIVLLLVGLLGLWFGGDIIVSPAKRIARRLKISEIIIGLTIVSIGTSIPEIATNVTAGYNTLKGLEASGIAIGNVVGSCMSQITIILGLVGLFATLYLSRKSLIRDGFMMLLALLAMALASIDLKITRLEGITLASIYLIYLAYLLWNEKLLVKTKRIREKGHTLIDILLIMIGIGIVLYSANLVVTNGVTLAHLIGIKETIIGLFVGLGTSLPELSVSIKALLKKSGGLSIGNLLGSNITDPLLSLGLGSSIAGFTLTTQTLIFDIPFWFIGSSIALLLLFNHTNLNKLESTILILIYILFMYLQFFIF